MRDDLLTAAAATDDVDEATLRPRRLDEFVGQTDLKRRLAVSITAAERLGTPLAHVLLSGPPGLGKTTLAGIIAHSLGVKIRVTSGPAIERPGDLASILTNLNTGDVFFIDEIHRLPVAVEEILYSAMEDYALDLILGKGPSAQSLRLELPPFTLVGATTRAGLVSAPLRDRFGITDKLEYYTADEIAAIILRSATILDIAIDDAAAAVIAGRSRGTPRIANRLLARVRDYAVATDHAHIDVACALEALELFNIDSAGLDRVGRDILTAIITKFDGGPVGLSTLAIVVGEEPETVESAYEPYLLQAGLIARTPRGRVATANAYRHLGLQPPGAQTSLM